MKLPRFEEYPSAVRFHSQQDLLHWEVARRYLVVSWLVCESGLGKHRMFCLLNHGQVFLCRPIEDIGMVEFVARSHHR